MRASASANFLDMRLQMSSSNIHRPRDWMAHWLHAVQPRMGLLPIQRISLSMPSVASCWATSLRARAVLPFCRGLPLISNTFMVLIFIWIFLSYVINSQQSTVNSRRLPFGFFTHEFIFSLTECTEFTEILMLFFYTIAEGDEGEACDEAEEDVGDESADIAVLEHL